MKPGLRWSCMTALLAVALQANAQDLDFGSDRQTVHLALKGVRSVAVSTRGFTPEFDRFGLSAAGVREVVESRLRARGIGILTEEQALRDPSAALMDLTLHANELDFGMYSCSTSLQLRQKIPLGTNSSSFITETVWSRGTSGWKTDMELRFINGEVASLVDQFLLEHAAQNPATN
ncbi:MAG: hypothetical protein NFCOHLIN_00398 [Gammaproteobacteria bacterium]|nr:hypothetical protein [Gammaproteobacteria bacterium]